MAVCANAQACVRENMLVMSATHCFASSASSVIAGCSKAVAPNANKDMQNSQARWFGRSERLIDRPNNASGKKDLDANANDKLKHVWRSTFNPLHPRHPLVGSPSSSVSTDASLRLSLSMTVTNARACDI